MKNLIDLHEKRYLVTGASSGIGRAIAVLLSQLGAHVILVGRNNERLQETLSSLEGDHHQVEPFDLSQTDKIPQWMAQITEGDRLLDGFVHCAAVAKMRAIRFETDSTIEEVMRVNLFAALSLIKGYQQKKVGRPGGSLIVISSIFGIVGQPGHSVYSASKGALVAMVRSMALELSSHKTRINCIAPGLVATGIMDEWKKVVTAEQIENLLSQYPLGIGSPEDVANAVAFFLSGASRWITGTTLVMDGGYTSR